MQDAAPKFSQGASCIASAPPPSKLGKNDEGRTRS